MVVTTKQQRAAIHYKWLQAKQQQAEKGNTFLTYREFRKSVLPMFAGDGAVTVQWCGMWLAIETDGYVHS